MSNPWRVCIADDEPLARERIRQLLQRHPTFTIVAECANGRDVLEVLREKPLDVLFLDIRMPHLDGVQIAEMLNRQQASPAVVFVTAHSEHAIRAFDLDAVDYLVKPVDIDRFERAIVRVTEVLVQSAHDSATPSVQVAPDYPTRFAIRDSKGAYFVSTDAIDRVEADGNYMALVIGGRRHLFRETMQRIETRLDPAQFVRIHRSIIVRIARISRIESCGHGEYTLTMSDGTKLTSSRNWSQRLRELLR